MSFLQEIVFSVEEADEGGYIAEALGEDIVTEADTLEELRANIREAVNCHFGDEWENPFTMKLRFKFEPKSSPQLSG